MASKAVATVFRTWRDKGAPGDVYDAKACHARATARSDDFSTRSCMPFKTQACMLFNSVLQTFHRSEAPLHAMMRLRFCSPGENP
jgi:hypothetical protein